MGGDFLEDGLGLPWVGLDELLGFVKPAGLAGGHAGMRVVCFSSYSNIAGFKNRGVVFRARPLQKLIESLAEFVAYRCKAAERWMMMEQSDQLQIKPTGPPPLQVAAAQRRQAIAAQTSPSGWSLAQQPTSACWRQTKCRIIIDPLTVA